MGIIIYLTVKQEQLFIGLSLISFFFKWMHIYFHSTHHKPTSPSWSTIITIQKNIVLLLNIFQRLTILCKKKVLFATSIKWIQPKLEHLWRLSASSHSSSLSSWHSASWDGGWRSSVGYSTSWARDHTIRPPATYIAGGRFRMSCVTLFRKWAW